MSLLRVPWLTKALVILFDAVLGGLCMYGAIQWRYDFLNKEIPNNDCRRFSRCYYDAAHLIFVF